MATKKRKANPADNFSSRWSDQEKNYFAQGKTDKWIADKTGRTGRAVSQMRSKLNKLEITTSNSAEPRGAERKPVIRTAASKSGVKRGPYKPRRTPEWKEEVFPTIREVQRVRGTSNVLTLTYMGVNMTIDTSKFGHVIINEDGDVIVKK